ncbi:MAG: tetratricopeptide repeat protein [Burkholderiales bacterium]|nr:tetratricopeptide repeat protein [Burkholderiales bacterium]
MALQTGLTTAAFADEPNHASVAALAHHTAGRLDAAAAVYQKIVVTEPDNAGAWHLLGVIALQQGDLEGAHALIEKAIALRSEVAQFHEHLGLVLAALRQPQHAVAAYTKSIALNPAVASVHGNLASSLLELERLDAAAHHFRQALQVDPAFLPALRGLGNVLLAQGQVQQAVVYFEQAATLQPDSADDAYNLGNALRLMGSFEAAIDAYQTALALHPQNVAVLNNLGSAHKSLGQLDAAAVCYLQALAIDAQHARALNNLGEVRKAQLRLDEAIGYFQAALAVSPAQAEVLSNLGDALKEVGQIDEALACFDAALVQQPDLAFVASNRLLTRQYAHSLTALERFAAHQDFAARFEQPLKTHWQAHGNLPQPGRRIRLGYVSPDFRAHPVASFLLPVLAQHDRGQFEIFCYYLHHTGDAVTSQVQALADRWCACYALADDELAARIRADGIDVLVDLAGHTAHNRLLMLARKPAPVQISYLGYVATTGLAAIDYRLTDRDTDPPNAQACYSETLWRLDNPIWWCYRPPADLPDVMPLPCLKKGVVTFGSTNNFAKVSPMVLALWAKVLRAVPDSRLVVAAVPAGSAQKRLLRDLAALGGSS